MSTPGAVSPRLRVRGVSKSFGSHRALSEVWLDVAPGELHGLVGQNGSGKTTLVKVLSGYHAPDPGGEVTIDGRPLRLPVRPLEARRLGVSVVHQSLGLVDEFSVAENMRMGRLTATPWSRRIRWAEERAKAAGALDRLGRHVNLDTRAGALSEQDRATVAIARAIQDLPDDGGLIIFDESTRALTRDALTHFYELVRTVLKLGAAALVINHRLEEVLDHTDRVTVLRDGEIVASALNTSALSEESLTHHMLGYELEPLQHRHEKKQAATAARAHVHEGGTHFELSIAEGEVVGVTGLVGSGFEDVPYLLAGARPSSHGEVWVGAQRFDLGNGRDQCRRLLAAGVALVPERREQEGLALELSVLENLTLPRVGERRPWWLGRGWQRREAHAMIERLGIRPPRADVPAHTLSGGNQQKVQLGKWLAGRPRLLLVHEPTHAVDVGARHDIVMAIHQTAAAGCGVLVASTDPQELSVLCDRVLVFDRGQIAKELPDNPTPTDIIQATYTNTQAIPS